MAWPRTLSWLHLREDTFKLFPRTLSEEKVKLACDEALSSVDGNTGSVDERAVIRQKKER
jgi:hypothetical protein